MMRPGQAYWLLCLAVLLLHQLLQKGLGWRCTLADSYLDPLLCMPLLLGLLDWELKWRYGRGPLSSQEVIGAALLFSFLFEILFPRWSAQFTADVWDVLAYGLGALGYLIAQRLLPIEKA